MQFRSISGSRENQTAGEPRARRLFLYASLRCPSIRPTRLLVAARSLRETRVSTTSSIRRWRPSILDVSETSKRFTRSSSESILTSNEPTRSPKKLKPFIICKDKLSIDAARPSSVGGVRCFLGSFLLVITSNILLPHLSPEAGVGCGRLLTQILLGTCGLTTDQDFKSLRLARERSPSVRYRLRSRISAGGTSRSSTSVIVSRPPWMVISSAGNRTRASSIPEERTFDIALPLVGFACISSPLAVLPMT